MGGPPLPSSFCKVSGIKSYGNDCLQSIPSRYFTGNVFKLLKLAMLLPALSFRWRTVVDLVSISIIEKWGLELCQVSMIFICIVFIGLNILEATGGLTGFWAAAEADSLRE
jgi:hypothetical protein